MVIAVVKAISRVEALITGKRADMLFSLAAVAGTRAEPKRDEDKRAGVRVDFGEVVDRDGRKVRHYKVQPNKGADDPTLKDMAAKNSHQVVAEAFWPIPVQDS